MIIEICANSIESALAAQNAGADRIELCAALSLGGITPSQGLICEVKKAIDIPVHVLIRPRPGGFQYSKDEIAIMISDINTCLEMDCDGIVIGALNDTFDIDVDAMETLIKAAESMEITFHRAFDMLRYPEKELLKLKSMGVQRVLTSGQQKEAINGIELLKKLKIIAGKDIEIMPGAGISKNNVGHFKDAGFTSLHLSASGEQEDVFPTPTNVHFGTREPIANEDSIKQILAIAKT